MAPGWTRLTLAAFVALSGAFLVNIFYLQPGATGLRDGSAMDGGSGPQAVTGGEPATAWSLQLAARGETQAINGAGESGTGNRVELTRAIQRELKAKGYDAGSVDGVPGLVTRAAIMAYEADHGLALTAEPQQSLLQHIILGSGAGARGDGAPRSDDLGPEARTVVQTVQTALVKLGYAPGGADGRLSEETIRAIRKFESAQGMRQTGRISGPLVARLSGLAGSG